MQGRIHTQRGVTITQLLLGLVAAGLLALIAMRLVPVYLEAHSVGTILEGISGQKQFTGNNQKDIRETFSRRLIINDINNIKAKDLQFEEVRGGIEASVEYEVRRPFIANLDFVAHFKKSTLIRNK
ncbi:DUF4845 domain-containing protein [Arhodomonas sp. KWT2]|uniref:DUF4845 domain-containing protein n=1 Tax=Arhodomonas sp. KWT2 TaxID=3344194 RepID=UPI0035C07105